MSDTATPKERSPDMSPPVRQLAHAPELPESVASSIANSDWAAKLRHDLRNPLAAIAGYTELLKNQAVAPAEALEAIERNCKLAIRLIDEWGFDSTTATTREEATVGVGLEHRDRPLDSALPQSFGNGRSRPLRVLVVDDGRDIRHILRKLIAAEGGDAILAENGQQALQLLKQKAIAIDLVLMDVQMPDCDGLESTRELRKCGFDIPIVALSAGGSPAERESWLNVGYNDILEKPLSVQALRRILAQYARTEFTPT